MTSRTFMQIASGVLAAPVLARRAAAQAPYPSRLIRAIVPFSASSTMDIVGRIVTDPLSELLGQTIVIENRGGAGGSVGSNQTSKSEPDGHTVLINGAGHSAAPAAFPNIGYDPVADFSGVAIFGIVPNVLIVASSSGIRTVRQLVEKAKAGTVRHTDH